MLGWGGRAAIWYDDGNRKSVATGNPSVCWCQTTHFGCQIRHILTIDFNDWRAFHASFNNSPPHSLILFFFQVSFIWQFQAYVLIRNMVPSLSSHSFIPVHYFSLKKRVNEIRLKSSGCTLLCPQTIPPFYFSLDKPIDLTHSLGNEICTWCPSIPTYAFRKCEIGIHEPPLEMS